MGDGPSYSRRRFLATAAVAGASALAGCGDDESRRRRGAGAGGVPSGIGNTPASGGVGSGFAYNTPAVTKQDATHVARTADQLDAALESTEASSNSMVVIWVPADAAIDYTGRDHHISNAIIASSRYSDSGSGSSGGHAGGIIYSNSIGADSAAYYGGRVPGTFELGDNARLTGIRLRGPTSNVSGHPLFPGYIPYPRNVGGNHTPYYDSYRARGITITGQNVQVDNCEIFGWAQHGIMVEGPRSYQRDMKQITPVINNCSIHDNAMTSSGYGIVTSTGHFFAKNCFLTRNRHSIAGDGKPDAGYTLSGCFFGPVQSLFPTDMHYLGENNGNSSDPGSYNYRYRSGGLMRILNCTYTSAHVFEKANFSGGNKTPAIVIAGIPLHGVEVRGCRFVHSPPPSSGVFSQARTPGRHSEGPLGFVRWNIKNNRYNINVPYEVGQG